MPEGLDIRIHRAILHKVDHKNAGEPQLADLEIELTDPIRRYFARHIADSREHKHSRTAVFAPDPPVDERSFKAMSDAILADQDRFVPESQDMARHLFDHLNGRTAPGDLVVCLFSEGDADPWLAVLKMDPSSSFAGDRVREDGQWRAVLRPVQEVLPGTDQELQKCAFVLPLSLRQSRKYHLKVLDQQSSRYGVRESVAGFFSEGFLQCKIALSPAEITVKYYRATLRWLKRYAGGWSEEDRERALAHLHQRMQLQQVDITDYAKAVIPTVKEQQAYLAYLQEQGIEDLTFAPDPDQRRKLTAYAEYEGDDDLHIRIRADAVRRMLSCQRDEATGEVVITIRTTSWTRVRGEADPCS
jgi:hypothetical protein